jgi:hypothetical protein
MRRDLECVAVAGAPAAGKSMALTPARMIRALRELVAALDRRAPQVERAGEESIAHDAALLRARALKRIEQLEHEPATARGDV